MSIGQGILLIVLLGALIAIVLIIWNSRQDKNAPAPSGQRRDLDTRIDSVTSGAVEASNRAVSVAASPEAATIAADWSTARAAMLAVEGDIVSLDVHLGDAPVGLSLAQLERALHALREAVDSHVELRTDGSDDEHALELSQNTVTALRNDVDFALDAVNATRT